MSTIRNIISFFRHGASVLHRAATGSYQNENAEIERMKKEMFAPQQGFHTDLENLRRDRDNIGRDMRRAINKVMASNG